ERPHLDRDRWRAGGGGRGRRRLRRRHDGPRPRAHPLLLPGADRGRSVRADLHARRPDLLPRRPASRRGLDLRQALDPLARLQGRGAATLGGGGDHEEGRWYNRVIITITSRRLTWSNPSPTATTRSPPT